MFWKLKVFLNLGGMYQFLIGAITNYHKLGGLKQSKFILFCGQKSYQGLTRLTSRYWQSYILARGSRGALFLYCLQLLEASQIPQLMVIFKAHLSNFLLQLSHLLSLAFENCILSITFSISVWSRCLSSIHNWL